MIAFLCHARCGAEGKHASDTNPEQFVRALSLFADRRSCTFIFFPGQAELHFHFSCPPKTALAPNESQFTTELDGFSVKSLRHTISKLTDPPATLFWTYLTVEVLRLNWLTKMWRNYDTRNKEIVHTGLFTLKDIDLEGGFTTSRFDTQLWDISETWKVLTVNFLFVTYWKVFALKSYFVVVWNSSHSQWDRRRRPLHNQPHLSWEDQPEKKNFMEFLLNLLKSWWRANLEVEKNVAAIEIFCHMKIIFDAKELFFVPR